MIDDEAEELNPEGHEPGPNTVVRILADLQASQDLARCSVCISLSATR